MKRAALLHMGGWERPAWLHMDGWAGRSKNPIIVVGETPTRYRIRVDKRTRIGGPARFINPGETTLVPRRAVTFRLNGAT